METNKLVIDFMIRRKPVLFFLFSFSFVFIRKITRFFFVILDS